MECGTSTGTVHVHRGHPACAVCAVGLWGADADIARAIWFGRPARSLPRACSQLGTYGSGSTQCGCTSGAPAGARARAPVRGRRRTLSKCYSSAISARGLGRGGNVHVALACEAWAWNRAGQRSAISRRRRPRVHTEWCVRLRSAGAQIARGRDINVICVDGGDPCGRRPMCGAGTTSGVSERVISTPFCATRSWQWPDTASVILYIPTCARIRVTLQPQSERAPVNGTTRDSKLHSTHEALKLEGQVCERRAPRWAALLPAGLC
ncbi:hypothetical protein BC628DRAFT_407476 [Trametes gibbosa]|nr:hypothetical protein BC628DRAFT_407476 [Trametes gibbosa]